MSCNCDDPKRTSPCPEHSGPPEETGHILKIKEIEDEWLRRLRKEGAEQCEGKLRDPGGNGRCCLGVLGDVAVDLGICAWEYNRQGVMVLVDLEVRGRTDFTLEDQYQHSLTLPRSFAQRLVKKEDDNPDVTFIRPDNHNEEQTSLAGMNDAGWSFATIADTIEEQ